jgi:hypothetical protein
MDQATKLSGNSMTAARIHGGIRVCIRLAKGGGESGDFIGRKSASPLD